jgi:uncharacterized protein
MTSLTITRHDQAGRGEYRAEVDGAVSKLTYQRRGEVVVADYAYVPPHQRGGDIALQLVKALVDDARTEGFKIIPTCGYISATMRRHRDWDALRA